MISGEHHHPAPAHKPTRNHSRRGRSPCTRAAWIRSDRRTMSNPRRSVAPRNPISRTEFHTSASPQTHVRAALAAAHQGEKSRRPMRQTTSAAATASSAGGEVEHEGRLTENAEACRHEVRLAAAVVLAPIEGGEMPAYDLVRHQPDGGLVRVDPLVAEQPDPDVGAHNDRSRYGAEQHNRLGGQPWPQPGPRPARSRMSGRTGSRRSERVARLRRDLRGQFDSRSLECRVRDGRQWDNRDASLPPPPCRGAGLATH